MLLSGRDDFNIKVLQAFVELHEFADLNLVQALRWVVNVSRIDQTTVSSLGKCGLKDTFLLLFTLGLFLKTGCFFSYTLYFSFLFYGCFKSLGDRPLTLFMQAISLELQTAGRGTEDRSDDGGLCIQILPMQPRSLPIHRSDYGSMK